MTNRDTLREDIAYVRDATNRANATTIPSIYLLWAAIGLCGFALVDFVDDSRWIGRFWLLAGPGGVGLSLWLGFRAQRQVEQADRRSGIRWGLHWLAYFVAGMLGLALVLSGHLDWAGFGSLMVLLLSLSYFHAGLQFDRRLLPVAVVAAVCYLLTLVVSGYEWTLAGVLMASVLVWQARLAARTHDVAH